MHTNEKSQKYAGICPKCGHSLVWHTATLTGEEYRGCTNYPSCKYNTRSYPYTAPNRNSLDYPYSDDIELTSMLYKAQQDEILENTIPPENSTRTLSERPHENYLITSLFHITRMGNIPSILKFGLLSHNKIKKEEMWAFSSSNQEIQTRRGKISIGGLNANDYVPLFFSKKTPMLCAIETGKNSSGVAMVYICINPEIIKQPDVFFTDGNIASNATKHYCKLEDLQKLDWENIMGWNQDKIGLEEARRIKSAEVLVPHHIAPPWFTKLIVPDEEVKNKLTEMLPYNLPIEVNSEYYFTDRGRNRQ